MDINKAIKKQKKSYRRFLLLMCFIFFIFPFILWLTNKLTILLTSYMVIIQIMIVIAIILKTDQGILKYQHLDKRIKIEEGIRLKEYTLIYDKVVLVHTEKTKDDLEIVIVTLSNSRNKKVKQVDEEFLVKYSILSQEYLRIKKLYPEDSYYYIVIKKGGYIKHKVLKNIYRCCVKAKFSANAIESIKQNEE